MIFHQRLGFRQVGSQETEGGKKQVALLEKML
jgi:predicted GNAT superfamily acetyltransferase